MAHAEPPNRSRIAWPNREVPEPPKAPVTPPHRHKTTRLQWLAIVGLYLVVALNSYLVLLDHQFVLGRGQYRDAEDARMEQENIERLRLFACDLLDGLPAGPLLDPKRAQYECGPGVPRDQLSPDAQADLGQLRGPQPEPGGEIVRPGPATAPESAPAEPLVGTPPITAPASSGSDPSATSPTPATASPAEPSTPAPAVDVSPLTDTVCDLTGICL